MIRDAHGWIDDFSAPAGAAGHPLTRKIYAMACLRKGMSLEELRGMGYTRDQIAEVLNMMMDQVWSE